MRSSKSSPTAGRKLTKLVRFLDRVEIVPSTPFSHYDSDEEDDASISSSSEKQQARSSSNDYEDDILDEPAIGSRLGRRGSLDESSNRASNNSKRLPITTDDSDHIPMSQEFHPPSPPPSSLTADSCASESHHDCSRQAEPSMIST